MAKKQDVSKFWEVVAYVGIVLGIIGIILVILKIIGLM